MSLAAVITASLKKMAMDPAFESELLTKDKTKAKNRNEGQWWDYKEQLEVSSPFGIAKLARHVLAFHNAKGGAICIGIDDKYVVKGIPASDAVDTKRVNDKLKAYVGPRVKVFQETIELANGRVIWIVFVPGIAKNQLPVATQRDAPIDTSNNKSLFKKNTFFLRVDDESKACQDPIDIYSLFTDVDASQQEAYALDIDEPYFRLLAPHCEQFIGRREVLDEVRKALQLRHPVISLDGLGGVGKSAVAIELAKQFYDGGDYEFLISLSAKSRVWQGSVMSRVAGFSGITEFLETIANCLGLPPQVSMDDTKAAILDAMTGIRGLLLIDNIEDVSDDQVISFLYREVPDPVKVLVTSRISRNMGALSVPVPEMLEDEAIQLFEIELKRQGYSRKVTDSAAIRSIVKYTGGIPLALKWSASIAAKSGSLRTAEDAFKGAPIEKREFLDFCFTTMFDELDVNARDVALLYPYLGTNWTLPILSIALDIPEEEVVSALDELENRGVVFRKGVQAEEMPGVLPLTKEFLAIKVRNSAALEEAVDARLADALGQANPLVANLDSQKGQEVLAGAIERKIAKGDLVAADRLAKLMVQQTNGAENKKAHFYAGQILYMKDQAGAGKEMMQAVLREMGESSEKTKLDLTLGTLLLDAVNKQDRVEGALQMTRLVAKGTEVHPQLLGKITELLMRSVDISSVRLLLSVQHKAPAAASIAKAFDKSTLAQNSQQQHEIGPALKDIFEEAARAKASEITPAERQRFATFAQNLAKLF
ncbi:MAG TPA: RNA-binding domain-containing protein [Herbaspirillum sp.]|uniref:ATP-binding protein n=1 Tax=Herbaspirillum sp. TaxID=1890675 RepID=UPI002D3EEB05|nr:RNA-binding domain-containing protein [Herbaspirillum sp.]HZG18623.1 RNA-binding domain-containing protein [Herbaspirillum sp.]